MKLSLFKKNKKNALVVLGIILVFMIGFGVKSILPSTNIAIVDLKDIVRQSQKVMRIHTENNLKLNELSNWLDSVEKELRSENDKSKRQKLAKQYKNLAQEKEKFIKEEYDRKIQEVDTEITDLIVEVASKVGCKIILDKNLVIKGGKDITADVIKKLNH